MDTVTQQNAATVEESASSSEGLAAQSQTLLDLVCNLAAQINATKKDTLQNDTNSFTQHDKTEQTGKINSSVSHRMDANSGNKDMLAQTNRQTSVS